MFLDSLTTGLKRMIWSVAVTTAPRRRPTLDRTLASLAASGFDAGTVFSDRERGTDLARATNWTIVVQAERVGAWRNWLIALERLVTGEPEAQALLLCQDDVLFCRGLRAYLERTLWPDGDAAACSPYCPALYRSDESGWHREDHGWDLVGAQCWAIPRPAAEAILRDLGRVKADKQIDARIGRWALQTGRSVWYHTPSLAEHLAPVNSALGHNVDGPRRRAADFVGESHDVSGCERVRFPHDGPSRDASRRPAPPSRSVRSLPCQTFRSP